jgi:hypothetical protein
MSTKNKMPAFAPKNTYHRAADCLSSMLSACESNDLLTDLAESHIKALIAELTGLSTKPIAVPPDAECLDWLEMMANRRGGILLHDGSEGGRLGLGLRPGTSIRTLRQAIAAAMVEARRHG